MQKIVESPIQRNVIYFQELNLSYVHPQGQMKVKRPGECCEECVSTKGSCLYEGAVRYHADMWNGTGCEFCTCERGQVLCQSAECARLECSQVRAPNLFHSQTQSDITTASLDDIIYQHWEDYGEAPKRHSSCFITRVFIVDCCSM